MKKNLLTLALIGSLSLSIIRAANEPAEPLPWGQRCANKAAEWGDKAAAGAISVGFLALLKIAANWIFFPEDPVANAEAKRFGQVIKLQQIIANNDHAIDRQTQQLMRLRQLCLVNKDAKFCEECEYLDKLQGALIIENSKLKGDLACVIKRSRGEEQAPLSQAAQMEATAKNQPAAPAA